MSKNSDWRSELEQVAAKLRDPFKMRMAVAGVTLAVMCFGINDPIHGRMKRNHSRTESHENDRADGRRGDASSRPCWRD